MKKNRDAYKDAIDRVRSAHRETISPARVTVVCPRCGTKQVVSDAPGGRFCLRCGFEFRQSDLIGQTRR